MKAALSVVEPPRQSPKTAPSYFLIGQDEAGNWIAKNANGRDGGLFVSREAAMKYVAGEINRRRCVAIFTPRPLKLWT